MTKTERLEVLRQVAELRKPRLALVSSVSSVPLRRYQPRKGRVVPLRHRFVRWS